MSDPSTETTQSHLSDRLSPKHLRELRRASGIKKRVIAERQYETVTSAQRLMFYGYPAAQARRLVPGLLIPLYGPKGDRDGATFKPSDPKPGKAKYEGPSGGSNVVDCHPSMSEQVQDPSVELFITEGNKKADSAVSQGLCCLALTGVDNWRTKPSKESPSAPCPQWEGIPLFGRAVTVVLDSDVSTNPKVSGARRRLTDFLMERGAKVQWIDLPATEGGDKVGLDDYFVSGGTVETLRSLAYGPTAEEKKKPTLGKTVIEFVRKNYDLYRTPEGQAFAVPNHGENRLPITFPQTGGRLTEDVRLRLAEDLGQVISKSTVSDAMGIIHAMALREEGTDLHLRSAATDSRVVIDLGQVNSTRCIVITAKRWEMREAPPSGVFFRRESATLPLPEPRRPAKAGQGWKALCKILGFKLDSREFLLVRGWLCAAPLAHFERPLLLFVGAPGSAKTARGLVVLGVWDPKRGLGSSFGKNLEDDRTKANATYLVGYDNLSTVSEAQSDHVARMVTGDAPEKRSLYSNDELHSMYYRRTGVLTAINLPTGFKPDAVERLVAMELNRMKDFGSENLLTDATSSQMPIILADALDGVVQVLRGLPALYADEPRSGVRMKDYWLALLALGAEFADAYAQHCEEGMLEIAKEDPWVRAFVAWADSLEKGKFVGSPSEMFNAFNDFQFSLYETGDADQRRDRLPDDRRPKDASTLMRVVANYAPPLRASGVEVTAGKSNGARFVKVVRK